MAPHILRVSPLDKVGLETFISIPFVYHLHMHNKIVVRQNFAVLCSVKDLSAVDYPNVDRRQHKINAPMVFLCICAHLIVIV